MFVKFINALCSCVFFFVLFFFFSESGSDNFDKFLNLLGDTICLQGWAGYRGGLDTKSRTNKQKKHVFTDQRKNIFFKEFSLCSFFICLDDTTGINSIYTVYQGHELMFHVSTMLPYSKENKQQVR